MMPGEAAVASRRRAGRGARRLRFALAFTITGCLAWWLFADTYARHVAPRTDAPTIRFAHFGTYQDYQLWKSVIADFERAHPDVRVRQEYVVGLSGHYNTKMRQQILSHTLPEVALIQLGPFHELARHFADLSGLLLDSEDADRKHLHDRAPSCGADPSRERKRPVDDPALALGARNAWSTFAHGHLGELDPTGVAAFQFRGKQRGLPISGGNLLIYANAECFERAGAFRGQQIPYPRDDWTIDNFRRTAELLTCDFDGDGVIDQFGFWQPRWVYYLPFLESVAPLPGSSVAVPHIV